MCLVWNVWTKQKKTKRNNVMRVQFVDGVVCAVKEELLLQRLCEKRTLIRTPLLSQPSHRPASWHESGRYWFTINWIWMYFFFFINSSIGSAFSLYIIILFLGKNSPLYISEQRFFYSLQFLLKYLFTLSSVQLRLIVSLVNVIPKVNPGSLSAWH